MGFVVAIDGPAAAGKGTISRAVADHFGFQHLDTGLLYRAVGARVQAGEDPIAAARTLTPNDLERPDLRTPEIAAAASRVATDPALREALVAFQRSFCALPQGAVLDGRDICTVICPDAEVKFYVTAAPEVRAERRFAELSGKGMAVTQAQVLEDVLARDARDMCRADAPLVAAPDATILDTSDMSIAEAVASAIAVVDKVRAPSS
ncbi:cytidylate kinase [Jannaschia pagri]|uniref:Cytidylate kinase n=1 Tax=Jannaschia pagri TaxID=2829797 RepID=A0ABQ4NKI0_9RHOB|nr:MULTISPECIES: d(CMP) kinase [unclassified Jannaschia]GIT91086.1 cytidylate kinase [Jannaschia sp. AI_61]GIT94918.1 cytidylate kinase [Jannaschia sp. AI_62]